MLPELRKISVATVAPLVTTTARAVQCCMDATPGGSNGPTSATIVPELVSQSTHKVFTLLIAELSQIVP